MSNRSGFIVDDDQPGRVISIRVRADWESVDLDELQTALTNAYATAFSELTKRIEARNA
jgi:hypothetical protein